MDGTRFDPVRCTVTPEEYARAVILAYPRILGGAANANVCGMLWAQYIVETGGVACWNWNIGNVKKVNGDGFDYHCLNGVWEGASRTVAALLIKSGEAVADPSKDHAKAVGFGRVSIIFPPPHPESCFRRYADLSQAMNSHLKFLALGRYEGCWRAALQGDVGGFANAIKRAGYFSADAGAYAANMRPTFAKFMASGAFEKVSIELPKQEDPLNFRAYDMATEGIFDPEK